MESATSATPYRQVRALFDETTIAVYQAYPPEIAEPALAAGTFVPPFSTSRMTWIKPSFLWMAYRSGWGTKPGQTRVLRIHIKRTGFEWALGNSCLSHYDPKYHSSESAWRTELKQSPVRIQWDPEQTIHLQPQQQIRSIQIGLSGEAVPSTSTTGSPPWKMSPPPCTRSTTSPAPPPQRQPPSSPTNAHTPYPKPSPNT